MEKASVAAMTEPNMDKTGQVPPPPGRSGGTPRVTATLWQQQGTLIFSVELNGVSVTRREDNDMVNGYQLLRAAAAASVDDRSAMPDPETKDTAERHEKLTQEISTFLEPNDTRHDVFGDDMAPGEHLKGVWIPLRKALELANEKGITEKLFPLFVNRISELLYSHAAPVVRDCSGTACDGHSDDGHVDLGKEGEGDASRKNDGPKL
jgi:enhanced filamentous growth protein 1